MRVIFMGTPDFAVPALEAVVAAGHTVVAVICQPDRAKDRKGNLLPVSVKSAAQRLRLPVYAFERLREQCDFLRNLNADIGVTAAYGQILTQEILDIPKYGVINVHASLLPKYRGSSPIQWAVINGETETGVTIMQTEKGLDCGDILSVQAVPIPPSATAGDMFAILKTIGARLLVETLAQIEHSGRLEGKKQDEALATKCTMLTKNDGLLNWRLDATTLYNRIRGLNPWPVAFTFWQGQVLKIFKAEVCAGNGQPGEVLVADRLRGDLIIACGQAALRLSELQLPGKRVMTGREFLCGHSISVHSMFTGQNA